MWDDDGDLRRELTLGASRLGRATNAPAALTAMRPAMRRIRRRRAAVRVTSLALLLFGGTLAAQALRSPDSGSLVVDGDTPPAPANIGVTTESAHPAPSSSAPGRTSIEVGAAVGSNSRIAADDDAPVASGTESSALSVPAAATVPPSSADPEISSTAPEPPSDDGVDRTDAPDPTGAGDDSGSVAPTVTVPPATPASEVVFTDSRCGSVQVDMATSPPTVIAIAPAPGYTYRLEDPEPHRIVVQFKGTGEDCEVKVPAVEHAGAGDSD